MPRLAGRRAPGSRPKIAQLMSANPQAGRAIDEALDDLEALYLGLPAPHARTHLAFRETNERDGLVARTLPNPISYGDPGSAGDPTLGLAAGNHRHPVEISVPDPGNIPGANNGFPFRTLQDQLDYLTAQAVFNMSLTIVRTLNWR